MGMEIFIVVGVFLVVRTISLPSVNEFCSKLTEEALFMYYIYTHFFNLNIPGTKAWVALKKQFHLCRLKPQKFETATGKENSKTETEGRTSGRKLPVARYQSSRSLPKQICIEGVLSECSWPR